MKEQNGYREMDFSSQKKEIFTVLTSADVLEILSKHCSLLVFFFFCNAMDNRTQNQILYMYNKYS